MASLARSLAHSGQCSELGKKSKVATPALNDLVSLLSALSLARGRKMMIFVITHSSVSSLSLYTSFAWPCARARVQRQISFDVRTNVRAETDAPFAAARLICLLVREKWSESADSLRWNFIRLRTRNRNLKRFAYDGDILSREAARLFGKRRVSRALVERLD